MKLWDLFIWSPHGYINTFQELSLRKTLLSIVKGKDATVYVVCITLCGLEFIRCTLVLCPIPELEIEVKIQNKHWHSQSLYGQESQKHCVLFRCYPAGITCWGHHLFVRGFTLGLDTVPVLPGYVRLVSLRGLANIHPSPRKWKKTLLKIYGSSESVCRVVLWVFGYIRLHVLRVVKCVSKCVCEKKERKKYQLTFRPLETSWIQP